MNFAVTALNDWKSYPLFASLRYSTQVHNKCNPLEGQHNEPYVSILLSIYPFLSHDFHTCYSLNSFLPLSIHTANTSSLCPNSDWFSFCFVRGDRRITTWLWAWQQFWGHIFSIRDLLLLFISFCLLEFTNVCWCSFSTLLVPLFSGNFLLVFLKNLISYIPPVFLSLLSLSFAVSVFVVFWQLLFRFYSSTFVHFAWLFFPETRLINLDSRQSCASEGER